MLKQAGPEGLFEQSEKTHASASEGRFLFAKQLAEDHQAAFMLREPRRTRVLNSG